MAAEQIVDSAFHVVGQRMNTELLTMDIEGTFNADRFLNFGRPQHAWEFTTLANERDRPSLALPRAQAVVDVLKAFGWRNSRPEPLAHRDETPNLIQPGVLANGTLGTHLVRLTDANPLTASALAAETPQQWINDLYLRMLTRRPTREEFNVCMKLLTPGFDKRQVPNAKELPLPVPKRFRYVSWSNHLNTEANKIKIEIQTLTRLGPPPTRYLSTDWRRRAEDVIWAAFNSPEMVIIP